jgi:hypothetical protein
LSDVLTELDDWPEFLLRLDAVISVGLAIYDFIRREDAGSFRLVTIRFGLVPITELRTHELAEPDRVRRVVKQIRSTGTVRTAIAVDSKTMVVLDGVHRLTALAQLGARKAPAWLLDYVDDEIVVFSKGGRSRVPKEAVLRAATKGPKMAPKSTRHMVKTTDGELVHISKLEGDVSVPLSDLM